MRRLILSVLLVACSFGISGCFTLDRGHNRNQWDIIKQDLVLMHEDLDFILCLHEPSQLDEYHR